MSVDFLEKIVEHKKSLLKDKKAFYDTLRQGNLKGKMTKYGLFKKEISKPDRMNLIAEIKKASPSKGLICRDFDVANLTRTYVENGADAISVITENKYFLGKPDYVRRVTEYGNLPVLFKDFIIDEVQIHEAFRLGASAILLIAAILDKAALKNFLQESARLDLDVLVEVHNEKELDRAVDCGADIIGVNNRDLHTFEVDLKTAEKLIPKIPKGKVVVAESGIKTHNDIVRLQEAGANAVLIGEIFLRAEDIGKKIRLVMQGSSE